MGRVPLRGVAQEQAEVQEWEDPVAEEWAVPEPVQGLEGNVCVQNARRLLLMKSEHPVTL
jgi:hypothetical protein